MSIFSCAPGSWNIFDDPEVSEDEERRLLSTMKERILQETFHSELQATSYETNDKNLQRILKSHFNDLEVALNHWHLWVVWRHENAVDAISEEDIVHERNEGTMKWRGRNKDGMLCCVVTGRMLNPDNRLGTLSSFNKFIIKTVEDGLKKSNESEQDKVCVIYDRRGLDFQHIDPNLYQFCRKTMDSLRMFYADRLGVLYVLHTNTFFWILYMLIIKPFMSLVSSNPSRLVVVETPEELLQYFDEDQLLLTSFSVEPSPSSEGDSITSEINASVSIDDTSLIESGMKR